MLFFAYIAPATDPLEYMRAHRAADEALVAGKLDEACAAFERCLVLEPKSSTSAYGLACALARREQPTQALDALEWAVKLGYDDAAVAAWDEDLKSVRFEARFGAILLGMSDAAPPPDPPQAIVRIWDERPRSLAVDVSVDGAGKRIAVAESAGFVRILDAHAGTQVDRSPHLGSDAWAVRFAPDGKQLAALTWDGYLHLWSVGSQDLTSLSTMGRWDIDFGDFEDSNHIVFPFGAFLEFDPTGERLIAAGNEHRGGSLLTKDGELLHAWREPLGGMFQVHLAWNADGSAIAKLSGGAELRFLDGTTGEPNGWVLSTPEVITSVAFDPSGKLVATGHHDGCLRVWELATRRLLWEDCYVDSFNGEPSCVNVVHFSSDGLRIAYTSDYPGVQRVLESNTGKRLYSFEINGGRMGEPIELAWSADGTRIWSAFVSGGMPLDEIHLGKSPTRKTIAAAWPPRVSSTGLATFASKCGVGAIDASTGAILWQRTSLGRDGELVQTPQGYFAGDLSELEDLVLLPVLDGDSSVPLGSLAVTLFDPKRVRACRAGVALARVGF